MHCKLRITCWNMHEELLQQGACIGIQQPPHTTPAFLQVPCMHM